jgi:RNA polymerase sigma factor (sigma-70 family)
VDTPETHTSREKRQSFDDFYRAHRYPIFRALLVTLRNPEAAAEAVDEAMTRALERWDKVVAYDKPERWVFRVGLNWAISAWRRTRREVLDILVEPSAEDDLPDPEVAKALARLHVRFRVVVVCRYYLDWSTDDTAQALGISPGTVKSRLSRALERLAAELGEQP